VPCLFSIEMFISVVCKKTVLLSFLLFRIPGQSYFLPSVFSGNYGIFYFVWQPINVILEGIFILAYNLCNLFLKIFVICHKPEIFKKKNISNIWQPGCVAKFWSEFLAIFRVHPRSCGKMFFCFLFNIFYLPWFIEHLFIIFPNMCGRKLLAKKINKLGGAICLQLFTFKNKIIKF